jgi:hypothetical protein
MQESSAISSMLLHHTSEDELRQPYISLGMRGQRWTYPEQPSYRDVGRRGCTRMNHSAPLYVLHLTTKSILSRHEVALRSENKIVKGVGGQGKEFVDETSSTPAAISRPGLPIDHFCRIADAHMAVLLRPSRGIVEGWGDDRRRTNRHLFGGDC